MILGSNITNPTFEKVEKLGRQQLETWHVKHQNSPFCRWLSGAMPSLKEFPGRIGLQTRPGVYFARGAYVYANDRGTVS